MSSSLGISLNNKRVNKKKQQQRYIGNKNVKGKNNNRKLHKYVNSKNEKQRSRGLLQKERIKRRREQLRKLRIKRPQRPLMMKMYVSRVCSLKAMRNNGCSVTITVKGGIIWLVPTYHKKIMRTLMQRVGYVPHVQVFSFT